MVRDCHAEFSLSGGEILRSDKSELRMTRSEGLAKTKDDGVLDRKGKVARNDNITVPPPVRAEVRGKIQFRSQPLTSHCP